MQTNLLTFFSQQSAAPSAKEDDSISEPTKECTENTSDGLKPQQLFNGYDEDDDDADGGGELARSRAVEPGASLEEGEDDVGPTQTSQISACGSPHFKKDQFEREQGVKTEARRSEKPGKRAHSEGKMALKKRRRNDSETERESISPNAAFVTNVPPASQGELPGAPRKPGPVRHTNNPIHELNEILKEEQSSDDLLEDKILMRIDQLDLKDCQRSSPQQLEDISEEHESATRCIEDLMIMKAEPLDQTESCLFERASLQSDSQISDDELLNHYLYQLPHLRGNLMWCKFVEAYYRYKNVFCIPSWINPERMRDINNHSVEDPAFDFSHIKWPGGKNKMGSDDKMHFTPAMTQYWEIKSANFDSVIFFKLGKFYELFYTDSMIAQELLGLKWMGNDSKSHVGFPESSLTSYGKQLVDYGFQVCVVEQMETPNELQQRKSIGATDDQAVKRSICEIYTKGTLTHERMLGALPSYLASLYLSKPTYNRDQKAEWQLAIIHLDVACCQGYYRTIVEHESNFCNIRNFIGQWPPREVLLDGTCSPDDLLKLRAILVELDAPPVIRRELNAQQRVQTRIIGEERLSKLFANEGQRSSLIGWMSSCSSEVAFRALEQLVYHLDKTLLSERIIHCSRFELFPDIDNFLAVNSASVQTLDIMPGLFTIINHTSTKFGQRMLRQWLSQPLLSAKLIRARQNGVKLFLENATIAEGVRRSITKLPDLERQLARLSSQILRQKDSASGDQGPVYFSETISKRISEFVNFVKCFQCIDSVVKDLKRQLGAVANTEVPIDPACNRLSEIIHSVYKSESILKLVEDILGNIHLAKCVPIKGVDADYDAANERVLDEEETLRDYLSSGKIWQDLGLKKRVRGEFVSTKYRFEIEVSDDDWKIIKHAPNASIVQMTSTRKGWVRFHTELIRSCVTSLVECEAERDLCLSPWLGREIRQLNESAALITHTISLIAEIDCMLSLAQYADHLQWKTFPSIADTKGIESSRSFAKLIRCYHPILAATQANFIPNDISVMAGQSIVLTGPNMGGKSTLSRQVALLIILAQIGSALPADGPCEIGVFDKIFTRIGLKDVLAQAKSTFLIELEDVNEMIRQATPNSILIIDEFGRGTNSREGALLASCTLHYITKHIKPAVLFSTHFPLRNILDIMLENHTADPDVISRIVYKHLGSIISESKLCFTYKLADGVFPESHGLRVAELAGIRKNVLALGH